MLSMAADFRKSPSEILISRRHKKNRNRLNGNGNRDLIFGNGSDTSPMLVKPKTEPAAASSTTVVTARKVLVLYYLTRNSHLEHPHLIDVPLSSSHGLYLRDVLNALNYHRGQGMANMYSWSFKRSYKNGYVWHDLSEDDLVETTNGHDYVLKGSELLQTHAPQIPTDTNHTGDNCSSTTTMMRQRNQSWSSFDNPQEYMVVKCESNRELAARFAADAATQTEEQRRLGGSLEGERKEQVMMTEMPSPPPSNSSSEGVSGARHMDPRAEEGSGKMKASEIVMQLITCGAPSRLKMQARRED